MNKKIVFGIAFYLHSLTMLAGGIWKSRARLTPEGEVALTLENDFILTPKKTWSVGSILFRLICLP